VNGHGRLLVESEEPSGDWSEFDANAGSCGYYWSAQRHIWLNHHRQDDLVVLHTFFPYQRSELSANGFDEALEFSLEALDKQLPKAIRAKLQDIARKHR
jgi:hypothetical protein